MGLGLSIPTTIYSLSRKSGEETNFSFGGDRGVGRIESTILLSCGEEGGREEGYR